MKNLSIHLVFCDVCHMLGKLFLQKKGRSILNWSQNVNEVAIHFLASLDFKRSFSKVALLNGLRTPREEITFTARPKIHSHSKVIHTKYSKHRPSTVAHTFECVCSKTNHGLNHGLFISLLKLINCPIH
jgi:hypothetical protein